MLGHDLAIGRKNKPAQDPQLGEPSNAREKGRFTGRNGVARMERAARDPGTIPDYGAPISGLPEIGHHKWRKSGKPDLRRAASIRATSLIAPPEFHLASPIVNDLRFAPAKSGRW
jgi:hypothetical protein